MNNAYISMCISDINKRRETLQEKNKKWTKELQEETMNILDQFITKKNIHDNQKKLEKMDDLIKKIYQFESQTMNFTNDAVFSTLKSEIENLGSYLTPKENEEITKIISKEIMALKVQEQKNATTLIDEIKNLLSSLNLSSVDFKIEGSTLFVKYEYFINEVKKTTLEKISAMSPYFNVENKQNITFEHPFIDELSEMLNNGKIEMTPEAKKLKDNISQIKSSWVEKERIESAMTSIDQVLNIISKDSKDIEMVSLVKYLETLKQKYLKEFQKLSSYLNEFDLMSYKQKVEEERKLKAMQKDHEMALLEYENLAYKLEKTLIEEPNNYDKKMAIESQMRTLTSTVSLSNDALLDANRKGKEKYYAEKNEKQALREAMTEKVQSKRNYQEELNQIIREEAMRELEYDNFEETYDFRNGDAYLANLDKEAIIEYKMNEIRRFAEMTPEERGLFILKQKGKISRDATLSNLTPQQISDMKFAYRDSSYDYITKYKELKRESDDDEKREKPNNLNKEYLLYVASCKDKANCLSFKEFAKQKYNVTMPSISEPLEQVEEKMGGPKI